MNEFRNDHGAEGQSYDLSQFDEGYTQAEVQDREFEEIDDGKYQVTVDRVEITKAKSSGNLMLKWTFKILGPKHEGRLLWRCNQFATSQNMSWLKTDLHTCGIELDKLSDLQDRLGELLDLKLEVTRKTRGENSNIYLDRLIEIQEGKSDGAGAAMQTPF